MELSGIFRTRKPIIGMLHAPALPGSPLNRLGLEAIDEWVFRDAEALVNGGVDGLILENFGDVPFYPEHVPPHTVAFMTRLAVNIRRRIQTPLGINVLRNDAESALAVAAAAGAAFIRVNIYLGARLTDQGLIEGKAHTALRYRRLVAPDVMVFADVDVKHSAPIAARALEEDVEDHVTRGRADAIIVTGAATGRKTSLDDIASARRAAAGTPVLAGSGVDLENIADTFGAADGLIVGSAFKRDSVTSNPVDPQFVKALVDAAHGR